MPLRAHYKPECGPVRSDAVRRCFFFFFFFLVLPAGNYETKIAINEDWAENYGQGGVQNGPNISFTVPGPVTEMLFEFDSSTKILTVGPYDYVVPSPPPPAVIPEPATVCVLGLAVAGVGAYMRRRRRA